MEISEIMRRLAQVIDTVEEESGEKFLMDVFISDEQDEGAQAVYGSLFDNEKDQHYKICDIMVDDATNSLAKVLTYIKPEKRAEFLASIMGDVMHKLHQKLGDDDSEIQEEKPSTKETPIYS